MSYNSIENSVDLGAPVTLFEFIYGQTSGDAFRYATVLEEVSLAGRTWSPHNLKHTDIVSSGKLDRAELTVTARPDIDVAGLFLSAPPSQPVMLNIWRGHALTLNTDEGWDEFIRIWVGRVLSCQWSGPDVNFKCEPVATSAKRVGLRRHYQYGCPHVLYGRACGVSEQANTSGIRVASVVNQIQMYVVATGTGPGIDPALLPGGIFTLTLPDGRLAKRTIVSATYDPANGILLKLMSSLPGAVAGAFGSVARGCQHTFAACKTFNNTSNYGGCPSIPTKDPFRSNTF